MFLRSSCQSLAIITSLLYWLVGGYIPSIFAADRIISLSPHTTEMAYAAGLGDKLIAVSAYSDYPEQAKKLEQVASWQGINFERILLLKPDLILAWRGGNPQRILDQLLALGIPIFYSDPKSIDDISEDIRKLASYSTNPEQAYHFANELLLKTATLKKHYTKRKPIRGLLQLGTQPLFTSSGITLQNQILTLCGVDNIFADSTVPWPQIGREQIVARRPQVIIIGGDLQQVKTVKTFWQGQLDVPVISIEADWFYRDGPRILLAARSLCRQLAELNIQPATLEVR